MANGVEKFTGIAQTFQSLLEPDKVLAALDQNKDKKIDPEERKVARERLIGYVLTNFKDLSEKIKTQLTARFAKAGLDVNQVLPGEPRKVSDTLVQKGKEWEAAAEKLQKEKKPGEALAAHQKAKESYRLAVELDPKNPSALKSLSGFLYEEGNHSEGRLYAKEAIRNETSTAGFTQLKDLLTRCEPSIKDPWDFIATELIKGKRFEQAKTVYHEAAKKATEEGKHSLSIQFTEKELLADELAKPFEKAFNSKDQPEADKLYYALRSEGVPSALIDGRAKGDATAPADRKITAAEVFAYADANLDDPKTKSALKEAGLWPPPWEHGSAKGKAEFQTPQFEKMYFSEKLAFYHAKEAEGAKSVGAKESHLLQASRFNPAYLHDLGNLYLSQKQPEKAESAYKAALAVNPTDSEAKLGLGRILYARGKIDEAYAYFKQPDVKAKAPEEFIQIAREKLAPDLQTFHSLCQSGKNDEAAALLTNLKEMGGELLKASPKDPQRRWEDLKLLKSLSESEMEFSKFQLDQAPPEKMTIQGEIFTLVDQLRNPPKDLPYAQRLANAKLLVEIDRTVGYLVDTDKLVTVNKDGSSDKTKKEEYFSKRGDIKGFADDLRNYTKLLDEAPPGTISDSAKVEAYTVIFKDWVRLRGAKYDDGTEVLTSDVLEYSNDIIHKELWNVADKIKAIPPYSESDTRSVIDQVFRDIIQDRNDRYLPRISAQGLLDYAGEVIPIKKATDELLMKAYGEQDPMKQRALMYKVMMDYSSIGDDSGVYRAMEAVQNSIPADAPAKDKLGIYMSLNLALQKWQYSGSGSNFRDQVRQKADFEAVVLMSAPSKNEKEKVQNLLLSATWFQSTGNTMQLQIVDVLLQNERTMLDQGLAMDKIAGSMTGATFVGPEVRLEAAALVVQIDQALLPREAELAAKSDSDEAQKNFSDPRVQHLEQFETALAEAKGLSLDKRLEQGKLLAQSAAVYQAMAESEKPLIVADDLVERSKSIEQTLTGIVGEWYQSEEGKQLFEKVKPEYIGPLKERTASDFKTRLHDAMQNGEVQWIAGLNSAKIKNFVQLSQAGNALLISADATPGPRGMQLRLEAAQVFTNMGQTDRITEALEPVKKYAEGMKDEKQKIQLLNMVAVSYTQAKMSNSAAEVFASVAEVGKNSKDPAVQEDGKIGEGMRLMSLNNLDGARAIFAEMPRNEKAQTLLANIQSGVKYKRGMQAVEIVRALIQNKVDKKEQEGKLAQLKAIEELIQSGLTFPEAVDQLNRESRFPSGVTVLDIPGHFRTSYDGMKTFNDSLSKFVEASGTLTVTDKQFSESALSMASCAINIYQANDFTTAAVVSQMLMNDPNVGEAAKKFYEDLGDEQKSRGRWHIIKSLPIINNFVPTAEVSMEESIKQAAMFITPFVLGRAVALTAELAWAGYAVETLSIAPKVAEGVGFGIRMVTETGVIVLSNMTLETIFTGKTDHWSFKHFGKEFGSMLITMVLLHGVGAGMGKLGQGLEKIEGLKATGEEAIQLREAGKLALNMPARVGFGVVNYSSRIFSFMGTGYLNEVLGLHEKNNSDFMGRIFDAAIMDAQMIIFVEGFDMATGGHMKAKQLEIQRQYGEYKVKYFSEKLTPLVEKMGLDPAKEGGIILDILVTRAIQGEKIENLNTSFSEKEIQKYKDAVQGQLHTDPKSTEGKKLTVMLIQYSQLRAGGKPPKPLTARETIEEARKIQHSVDEMVSNAGFEVGPNSKEMRRGLLALFLSRGAKPETLEAFERKGPEFKEQLTHMAESILGKGNADTPLGRQLMEQMYMTSLFGGVLGGEKPEQMVKSLETWATVLKGEEANITKFLEGVAGKGNAHGPQARRLMAAIWLKAVNSVQSPEEIPQALKALQVDIEAVKPQMERLLELNGMKAGKDGAALALWVMTEGKGKSSSELDTLIDQVMKGEKALVSEEGRIKLVDHPEEGQAAKQMALLEKFPNFPLGLSEQVDIFQIHPDNARPLMELTADKILKEAGHDPASPKFKEMKEALVRSWERANKGEVISETGWLLDAKDLREMLREGRQLTLVEPDGKQTVIKHAQGGAHLKDTARWSDEQLLDLGHQIGLKFTPETTTRIREMIHGRGKNGPFNYDQTQSALKSLGEAYKKASERGDFDNLSAKEKLNLRLALFNEVVKGKLDASHAKKMAHDLANGEIQLTPTGGEDAVSGKRTPLGYKVEPKKSSADETVVAAAYAGKLPRRKNLPQDTTVTTVKPSPAVKKEGFDGSLRGLNGADSVSIPFGDKVIPTLKVADYTLFFHTEKGNKGPVYKMSVMGTEGGVKIQHGGKGDFETVPQWAYGEKGQKLEINKGDVLEVGGKRFEFNPPEKVAEPAKPAEPSKTTGENTQVDSPSSRRKKAEARDAKSDEVTRAGTPGSKRGETPPAVDGDTVHSGRPVVAEIEGVKVQAGDAVFTGGDAPVVIKKDGTVYHTIPTSEGKLQFYEFKNLSTGEREYSLTYYGKEGAVQIQREGKGDPQTLHPQPKQGEKAPRARINDGDVIIVGGKKLTFHGPDQVASGALSAKAEVSAEFLPISKVGAKADKIAKLTEGETAWVNRYAAHLVKKYGLTQDAAKEQALQAVQKAKNAQVKGLVIADTPALGQYTHLDSATIDHHGRFATPDNKNTTMKFLDRFEDALRKVGGEEAVKKPTPEQIDAAVKELNVNKITTDNLADGGWPVWMAKNQKRVLSDPALRETIRKATEFEDFTAFGNQYDRKDPAVKLQAALFKKYGDLLKANGVSGSDRIPADKASVIMEQAVKDIDALVKDPALVEKEAATFWAEVDAAKQVAKGAVSYTESVNGREALTFYDMTKGVEVTGTDGQTTTKKLTDFSVFAQWLAVPELQRSVPSGDKLMVQVTVTPMPAAKGPSGEVPRSLPIVAIPNGVSLPSGKGLLTVVKSINEAEIAKVEQLKKEGKLPADFKPNFWFGKDNVILPNPAGGGTFLSSAEVARLLKDPAHGLFETGSAPKPKPGEKAPDVSRLEKALPDAPNKAPVPEKGGGGDVVPIKPDQARTAPEVGKELPVEWSAEAKGGKVSGKVKGLEGVEFMVAEGDLHVRSDQRISVNGKLRPEGSWIALQEGDTVHIGQEFYARRLGKLERIQPAADDAPVFAYGENGVILENGDGKTLTKVGDSKLRNQQLDTEQKALGILQQSGLDIAPPLIGRPASGELIIGIVEGKSLDKLSAEERKKIPAEAWDRFEGNLKKLQELGIHHNDLSGGNIIWTGKDLKLVDFGLAEIGVKSHDDLTRAQSIRKAVAEGKEGQALAPLANMKDVKSAEKVKMQEIDFQPAGFKAPEAAAPVKAPSVPEVPKAAPVEVQSFTLKKQGKDLDPSIYEVKIKTPEGVRSVEVRLDVSRTKQLYEGDVQAHIKDLYTRIEINGVYTTSDGSKLTFTGEVLGEGSTGTVYAAKIGDRTVAVKVRTHGKKTTEAFNRENAEDVRKMKMFSEIDPAYQGAALITLPDGRTGEVMPYFDPKTSTFFDNPDALKADRQPKAKTQIAELETALRKKGFDIGDVEFVIGTDGKVHIVDVEGILDKRFEKVKIDAKVKEALASYEEKSGTILPPDLVEKFARVDSHDATEVLKHAAEYSEKTGLPLNAEVMEAFAGLEGPSVKAILEVGAKNIGREIEYNGKKFVFTGEIVGVGSGRTVYRGYVLEKGVKTPVAIKMETHSYGATVTRSGEIRALEIFSKNGMGGVAYYGEPAFLGSKGNPSKAIVTNLAEGPVVGSIKDIPQADRAEVARQVAHDIAVATREGLNLRGDIQFVLARDAGGKPQVRWIDLESMGRTENAKDWNEAYQAGLINFFGKDYQTKYPDLAVPKTPQDAVKAGEAKPEPSKELKFDSEALDLLTGTSDKQLKAPDLPISDRPVSEGNAPVPTSTTDTAVPAPEFPKLKASSITDSNLRGNVEAIERKRDALLAKVKDKESIKGSSEEYTPQRMQELLYDVLERNAPLKSLTASEGVRGSVDEYMTAVVDYSRKNFPEAWEKAEKAENRNPYTGESMLDGKKPNYEAQYRFARMLYNEKLGLPLFGEPSPREKARLTDVVAKEFKDSKVTTYEEAKNLLSDQMLGLTSDFQSVFRKADPATRALMVDAFFGDQIHRPVKDPNAAFKLATFLGKEGFYRELGVSVDLAASPPQYYFSLGNLEAVGPKSNKHFSLMHTHPEKYFNPKGMVMGNEATMNVEQGRLIKNTSSVLFSPEDMKAYLQSAVVLAKAGKDVPGIYDAKSRTYTNWVQHRFGLAEVKIRMNEKGAPEKVEIRFGLYDTPGLDSQYKATETALKALFPKDALKIEKVKTEEIEKGLPHLTEGVSNPDAADRLSAAGGAGQLRYPGGVFGLAKVDPAVGKDQFLGVKVDPPFEQGLLLFFGATSESPFVDFAVEGAKVALHQKNWGRAEKGEKVPGFKQDASGELGFDHIVFRHEHESTQRGERKAGVYAANVDIEIMGRETVRSWDRAAMSYDENGRAIFILQKDFQQDIGKTTSKKDTKTNQVILSYDGQIISSFPVEKPKKGWVERSEVASKPSDFPRLFIGKTLSAEMGVQYSPFIPDNPKADRGHLYLSDIPIPAVNARTKASYNDALERANKVGAEAPKFTTVEVTIIYKEKPLKVTATVVEMQFQEPIGVREKMGTDGKMHPEPLYYNRVYLYENRILGGYPIKEKGEALLDESVWNPALRVQTPAASNG